MGNICRCNVPVNQPCAACGGAIPHSSEVTVSYVNGRRKGYAECQADVVAWLCQLGDTRWCPEEKAESYRVLWARIYDGEHVGAASKVKP